MNDEELLKLAAMAAGYEVNSCVRDGIMVRKSPAHRGYFKWSPLADDGEAFRLAVQLGIYTAPGPGTTCEAVTSFGWVCKVSAMDRAGAMRRAIVEAAAAVAKLNEQKEKDQLIGGMGQST